MTTQSKRQISWFYLKIVWMNLPLTPQILDHSLRTAVLDGEHVKEILANKLKKFVFKMEKSSIFCVYINYNKT